MLATLPRRARLSVAGRLATALGPEAHLHTHWTTETATLDELVHQNRIPLPDLVKIDVEGAEVDVLSGAPEVLARAKPVIVVSTHVREAHEATWSLLQSLGYAVNVVNEEPAVARFDYLGELVAQTLEDAR